MAISVTIHPSLAHKLIHYNWLLHFKYSGAIYRTLLLFFTLVVQYFALKSQIKNSTTDYKK